MKTQITSYFKKQLPAYYFIFAILLSFCIFYSVYAIEIKHEPTVVKSEEKANSASGSKKQMNEYANMNNLDIAPQGNSAGKNETAKPSASAAPANTKVIREKNGGLTRPILLVDDITPSKELNVLSNSLSELISNGINTGKIKSASIYVKDLDNERWIGVNDEEGYYPGSLMKLAVLIIYLKKSEVNPEILNKTLILEKEAIVPSQTYKDQVIKPGVPYLIKDLLYQMIVKSDNYATLLLNREADINELNKLFASLGLHAMDMHDRYYTITPKDYSKFMSVLYNASYLSKDNSSFALSLLSNSTFNRGLTRELPKNVIVAHKFGENVSGNIRQLHESGIVYTGTHTYLITVMTKGEKVSDLADEINSLSASVYHYFMP